MGELSDAIAAKIILVLFLQSPISYGCHGIHLHPDFDVGLEAQVTF